MNTACPPCPTHTTLHHTLPTTLHHFNPSPPSRPAGNPNVMVCERGTMFGYSDLVVDPRNLVAMRDAGCPVTADITHSLQQPAGRALEVGRVGWGGWGSKSFTGPTQAAGWG